MENEEIEINDNDFLRQFEATIEGELITVEYARQERKIFLTKLNMPDSIEEKGYTDKFLEKLLDKLKRDDDRVVPTSPEIAKFMRKHRRKYKDLLPVGLNI